MTQRANPESPGSPKPGPGDSPLPFGLSWQILPARWRHDGATATVLAGPGTDLFVDPAGAAPAVNAPRALADPPSGRWQLSARVAVEFGATFDAGVLLLWSDERHFAKLCFEYSPQRRGTVVSVVTSGASDDANAWSVEQAAAYLRISDVADGVYAFHSSADGQHWDLVRYFSLAGDAPMRFGIQAQSPTGQGCRVTFSELCLTGTHLTELRDGS